ncbi:MAG: ATP-binding protein [Lachnospiraceae bacterium]|nr:ATP-binding protein [Lachnospiraceae bacterium]
MYVAQIYSIILLSFGAAAFYLGISAARKRFRDYAGNAILGLLCFSSSVWCYGFGLVFLTADPRVAYWGRTLGMIGVFGYLIIVQILVGVLGTMPTKLYRFFCAFAFLGLIIYFPTVSPDVTVYYMEEAGMTYTFKPGLISNVYTVYSLIFAINMIISISCMIKNAKNRREKVTGNRMGITLIIVFVGMILDTILPMFGFGAIPGSSITQFLGLLVIYYAIVDLNKTRITPMNMSQYIYRSVSEPVMVFDTEGILRLSNKAADDIFSETFAKYEDKTLRITDFFALDKGYLDYEGNHRVDDTNSVIGDIPVQIQTSRIADGFGDLIGFIITVKDMTHINEIMDSLVEAKKLAEANSLAKSTFLANMSHEIRTPLNAIVGFSELLLKSDISDEDREQVDDIRNSSHNLLAIINDILDISKIESGKMELNEINYNIADVIKDAYLITETLAKAKGLKFSMDIDENIPAKLYGDPVRVRGILVNILNNAVKYTKFGSVRLEGKVKENDGDMSVLEFKVIDTGIGIKVDDKEKLFESFLRVDKKSNSGIEGTGLGLAIVKGFVELMGGSVDVESTYNVGTTFTVTIPQKIVENVPMGNILVKFESTSKSSIGAVKFPGVKVLAVDDNKVNLKVITKILKQYEMEAESADSGLAAIELCKTKEYDIILMDQMMPGMDGVEAMNHIRELGGYYASGKCLIVALTANAITGVKEQLIGEGFDGYLSKPINFVELEELLSNR